jgi:predicted Zn finger-like uncharacterized protein
MSADHIRFVCESCRAQYSIDEKKVGSKGVKVKCRKCGYFIHVKRTGLKAASTPEPDDDDGGAATQVMQTPMISRDLAAGSDATNPGLEFGQGPTMSALQAVSNASDSSLVGHNNPSDSFLGADEDEIGAVFDQVLRSGPTEAPRVPNAFDEEDDQVNTRVIDVDNLRQLTMAAGTAVSSPKSASAAKSDEVPETDWFVAIHEKQTGPLTLEKVKEHWDAGEISPDSLCWRSGYSDWIPLSEVKALAQVLAPKPPKPIIVAPPAPAIVSVPVQSAFSAGGLVQTVQSEIQIPMPAASAPQLIEAENTGSWRPSAASAFASLVKEEMAAIAKPSAPRHQESPGLLDLPRADDVRPQFQESPSPAPQVRSQRDVVLPPANPYMANPGASFSAPPVSQYRPQSNRNMVAALVAGGIALVALLGVVIWLATRPPAVVVPTLAAVAPPASATPVTPVSAIPPAATPVVGATPTNPTTVAVAPPTTAPAGTPPVPPESTVKTETPAAATPAAVAGNKAVPVKRDTRVLVARAEPPPVVKKDEPKPVERPSGGGDDFDNAFGGSKPAKKEEAAPPKKKEVYVPPAPGGGGDLKDSLEDSDKMEVLLANKPGLASCAKDHRTKEPGVTGRLVMRWQVQTSGKVTGVTCMSDEFKSTYMASCIGGVLKGLNFPKHKRQGAPMEQPFKF